MMNTFRSAMFALLVFSGLATTVLGQRNRNSKSDDEAAVESPLQFIAPKAIELKIGLQVTSPPGQMLGTTAMTVFPTEWPEQQVEVLDVTMPPYFRHKFRDLPGNNRQLMLFAQSIPSSSTVEATVHLKVTKSHIVGPEDTLSFTAPRRIPRDVKMYTGTSPYIDTTAPEIRRIVREIAAEDPISDWKRVEMYYDWVRDNIAYEDGELKSVKQALKDRTGDCEEMTSTFVALCRAGRIPARVVWIPNHCYPEFYLEDKEGNGHWFPCQAAGTRNFGSMPEYLPILQKGDRFKVPEKKQIERYLADYLKSERVSGGSPGVKFIRELLGDAAKLTPPDLGGAANLQAEENQTP